MRSEEFGTQRAVFGTKNNPSVSIWMFRARSFSASRHSEQKDSHGALSPKEQRAADCLDDSGERILEVGPSASKVELRGHLQGTNPGMLYLSHLRFISLFCLFKSARQ